MHLCIYLRFPVIVQPVKIQYSAYRMWNVAAPIFNPAVSELLKRASGSGFEHLKKCVEEAFLVLGRAAWAGVQL